MTIIAMKSGAFRSGVLLLLAAPCCVAAQATMSSSMTHATSAGASISTAPIRHTSQPASVQQVGAQPASAQSTMATATLPTVTVTANRRAVPLQTAPISATVVTGSKLNDLHITLVDQLQFISPSTTVNNFGQGNDFNIRGIGKGEHNTQTGTGVITYWNGVPAFPGYLNEQPYYDIASIQILRGPQGTFGGENATGGSVLVKTNRPVIDGGTHGYIQGQVGKYSEVATQGAINLPISSTVAARFAFYGKNRNSFYTIKGPWTGTNARKRLRSARFSLLWKPDDNLSVTWITYYGYFDQGALIGSPVSPAYPPVTDPFTVASNADLEALDHMWRSVLRVDYKFDSGYEFRSITGYQRGATKWRTDLDGTAILNYTFRDSVYETMPTQEFDLLSPQDGRLSWIIGTFWQWNKYTFPTGKFVTGIPAGYPATEYSLQGTNATWNRALFGQIKYQLADDLELAVGARYTRAQTTNNVFVVQYGIPINDHQVATFDNVSGKVSLGWTVNDKNYLYALVSTGFKPGGLNVPVGLGLPEPFTSEKVRSSEIGWKGKWANNHIRTQLDVWHTRYRDFQVKVGYPAIPTFGIELNVPGPTKMYGVEAQVQALLGGFSLFANVGWMHSSLGKFFATDTRLASVLPCDPVTGPASISCIDLEGREQTYAPHLTYSAGLQYMVRVGSDTIVPRVNYAHISSQWATLFQNAAWGDRIGSRNILGASIEWDHGSWVTSLYGTNLTNQHYVSANLIGKPGFQYYGPPRQYGIRITKYF